MGGIRSVDAVFGGEDGSVGEGSCGVVDWDSDATGDLLEECHGCSTYGGAPTGCRVVVCVESSGSHDVAAIKRPSGDAISLSMPLGVGDASSVFKSASCHRSCLMFLAIRSKIQKRKL